MTFIKHSTTFKRTTSTKMRTQAVTIFCALIAISCVGSSLCGLITELGKQFQHSSNAANNVGAAIPNARIDPDLGSNKVLEDAAKPIGSKIISHLNPASSIISPIPGEIDFFHKLSSILAKLLSSVKPHHCKKHKEDREPTTEAAEPHEAIGPLENENSTVVATEIPGSSRKFRI